MRIRKGICMMLTAGAAAGLLGGCSEKKVDYELDSEAGRADGANSLEELAGTEKWKDEWELDMGDGKTAAMVIDAEISVPEMDSMSVVEVEKLQMNGDMRRQLLDTFLRGEEIYYHDAAHQSREDLEDSIEELESFIGSEEADIKNLRDYADGDYLERLESDLERKQEKLLLYQEALETAGDTPIPATEYESCEEFVAYIDGVRYDIQFPAEGEDAIITIMPGGLYGGTPTYIPETASELKDYDYINVYRSEEAEGENECPLSQEEAREYADRFIESSGLMNMVLSEAEHMIWRGWNEDDGETLGEDAPVHTYGYSFSYYIGINGMPVTDFGDEWFYMDSVLDVPAEFYSMRSGCTLAVTEDGVIAVEVNYPLAVKKVTELVELLPLDTIQQIMKNEAMEHTDRYDFSTYRYSNAMDLIYFRMKDRENPDSYSYIPVWRLSQMGSSCFHPILVNAIDGSVIYIEDEL